MKLNIPFRVKVYKRSNTDYNNKKVISDFDYKIKRDIKSICAEIKTINNRVKTHILECEVAEETNKFIYDKLNQTMEQLNSHKSKLDKYLGDKENNIKEIYEAYCRIIKAQKLIDIAKEYYRVLHEEIMINKIHSEYK